MDRLLAPAQSRRSVTTPIVNGLDKPLGVKGCVSWVGLKKWRLPRLPPLDPWVNLWWITRNPYYKWTMEVGIPWYTGIPHHWGCWLLSASVSLLHPAGRGGLLLRPASQQDRVPLKMVLDGARTTFCMGKICAVFDCEHILISYYLSVFFAFKQTPIWLFHNSADSRVWYWGMTPVWLDQAMSGRTILELPSTPCAFKVQATSLQKWTTSLALCEFCYKLLLYVFSLSSILWASRCYIQHAHSSFSARLFYQILSQSYQTLKLFLDTFSWNWLLDRKNFEIKFD